MKILSIVDCDFNITHFFPPLIKLVKLLQHSEKQFHSDVFRSHDTVHEIKWDQVNILPHE